MILHRLLITLMCVSLRSAVRILPGPQSHNCSRQGLNCSVTITNCMDRGWATVNDYTPNGPEQLTASVQLRPDQTGLLQPVLLAHWTIKDEGSISHLKATELHVLVMATNENLCVRYSFGNKLGMKDRKRKEKWSFSAELVLDPGHSYHISVFNIPKPELDHSMYDISQNINVPGCWDAEMQRSQFCVERGSLWQPNISVSVGGIRSSDLTVNFLPDKRCDDYVVIVRCSFTEHFGRTRSNNQTTLNMNFSLKKWPRSCCEFEVEIKPLFPLCGQDCRRQKRNLTICPKPQGGEETSSQLSLVALAAVFVGAVVIVVTCFLCRKSGKPGVAPDPGEKNPPPPPQSQPLQHPPKVLVIYSQDHRLYRDVVLKLCAFLQAKCGTKVLVDLLDSTSVGLVGRVRWLEWQRRQLSNPSDKILVLCSRGVQAKWKAMCGHGRVTLREDILSPTDDMLTPFLNLFLPDMHQAGMLGKYMVAYFNDISTEEDVPSVFDIGVKYKLMKHFEELYFRILDLEKYQPGQVNHIEGIGGDEYFNCPSGEALKNAIESFQAFQLDNPDWFQKECVDDEEDLTGEADQLIQQLHFAPVLEVLPVVSPGPAIYSQDLGINENMQSVQVLTPELNPGQQLLSVAEVVPAVQPERPHQPPPDHRCPLSPDPLPIYIHHPVCNQTWFSIREEPSLQAPIEQEEDSLLTVNRTPILQEPLSSDPNLPLSTSCSQPTEMEEDEVLQDEVLEPRGKGPSSGSDQGYISKLSSQQEAAAEDPLEALAKLQEELIQLQLADLDLEGN